MVEENLLLLAGKYRLREHTVCIRQMRLSIWSTTGVDDLLTDDTDPDEIPYWADLWPSAVALARVVAAETGIAGKSVLELGCGAALPSIVAALAGARVTATDYADDALTFGRANANLNNARKIRFLLLDWRKSPRLHPFDIVLGADMLYERKLHPHLVRILKEAVSSDGRAVIADPCRPAAVDFMADMERAGWRIEMSEEHLPGTIHETVMVYTLRTPSSQTVR